MDQILLVGSTADYAKSVFEASRHLFEGTVRGSINVTDPLPEAMGDYTLVVCIRMVDDSRVDWEPFVGTEVDGVPIVGFSPDDQPPFSSPPSDEEPDEMSGPPGGTS